MNRAEKIVDVLTRNYPTMKKSIRWNNSDWNGNNCYVISFKISYLTNHSVAGILKYCKISVDDLFEYQIMPSSNRYFEVLWFVKSEGS
jgi:hypothetical protein